MVVKTNAVSYHRLLYTKTLADDVPKSFSINVAYPAPAARINSNNSVVLKENNKLLIFKTYPLAKFNMRLYFLCVNPRLMSRNCKFYIYILEITAYNTPYGFRRIKKEKR